MWVQSLKLILRWFTITLHTVSVSAHIPYLITLLLQCTLATFAKPAHIFSHILCHFTYDSIVQYYSILTISTALLIINCLTFKNGCALLEQILPFMCENLMNLFILQSNTQHIFTLRKPWTLKEVLKIYRSVLYSGVWNKRVSRYVYMYVALVIAWSRICWKCITICSGMQFSKCLYIN